MDMNEIEAIFFQECEEGLAGLESCFAELSGDEQDPETINTIFRHVHSIKGGAGAFGLERLQKYAHEFESLLDLVRSGKIALDDDLLSLLVDLDEVQELRQVKHALCQPTTKIRAGT